MNNKEKIVAEINKIPMLGRWAEVVFAAIEPYLPKYDREEMRELFDKYSDGYVSTTMDSLLNKIERSLGLHTPAPVGGERPMTDGEAEIAKGLDKHFADESQEAPLPEELGEYKFGGPAENVLHEEMPKLYKTIDQLIRWGRAQ